MTGKALCWATSVSIVVILAFASIRPAEAQSQAQAQTMDFNVPAQSATTGIPEFARQAGIQILVSETLVHGKRTAAVTGSHSVEEALGVLLKGTGLIATSRDGVTYTVAVQPAPTTSLNRTAVAGEVAASHTSSQGVAADQASNRESGLVEDLTNKNGLDEITVTGTHIRGTKDSPSPVLVFTRADIDAAGVNTIQQFLQSLPQNFGGASENTIGGVAVNSQTNNTVNGSAPNLRGLGADATLVLINGHRVAPGNSDGSFVDISMIPLTAIDRIEIVTDGASAIYGSDAVGGVVNIILRTKFDGAETRAQYGSVSHGSMHNVQVGQTAGDEWTGGSGVLSYQYFDQTPLSAASRDYLHSVPLPFNLLPEQVQQAVFANIDQEIAAGFNVHGDAIYSHRSSSLIASGGDPINGYYTFVNPDIIDSYSVSLGSTVKLPRQSELAVTATYSESDTAQQSFLTPSPSPLQFVKKTKSAIISVDANLDGVLAFIPAGSIRYAVGVQYRKESFGNTYLFPTTNNMFYPSRDVDAGYIELHVPVIGQTSGSHGDPALELTFADRGEHYSDFGSTNNPQIGLIWKALSSVAIRGTYGTSFKAPLLSELNPVPAQVAGFPSALFNPVPGETIPNTLVVYGGNPNLRPEKARVWTIGLDFKPAEIDGLTTKLTYYDIVFTDEIIVAGASVCSCDAFVDEAILGPDIVRRNPPRALIQQLISEPTYANFFNVDPATISAIFDSRSMNLSAVKTRGLDFGFGYKGTILGTGIDTGIDGGYILRYDNQFSSVAPFTSVLNTTYNPINLKLRARALATRGPLNGGVYINFTNAYSDTNVIPYGHVSSWTTADAVVSYEFGSSRVPFNGVTAALSVINLTDRAPPYVFNPFGYPITYDGANANALGRYISLRLQKRW